LQQVVEFCDLEASAAEALKSLAGLGGAAQAASDAFAKVEERCNKNKKLWAQTRRTLFITRAAPVRQLKITKAWFASSFFSSFPRLASLTSS